jgi:hypothetical protein
MMLMRKKIKRRKIQSKGLHIWKQDLRCPLRSSWRKTRRMKA